MRFPSFSARPQQQRKVLNSTAVRTTLSFDLGASSPPFQDQAVPPSPPHSTSDRPTDRRQPLPSRLHIYTYCTDALCRTRRLQKSLRARSHMRKQHTPGLDFYLQTYSALPCPTTIDPSTPRCKREMRKQGKLAECGTRQPEYLSGWNRQCRGRGRRKERCVFFIGVASSAPQPRRLAVSLWRERKYEMQRGMAWRRLPPFLLGEIWSGCLSLCRCCDGDYRTGSCEVVVVL